MRTTSSLVVLAILACASCGTDYQASPGGGGGPDASAPPGPGGTGGLPCDVQALLSSYCTSCHGNPPATGTPMSLVSYADLAAASSSGATVAQVALARMTSTTNPMPPAPAPRVPSADVATFEAWVNAGMPPGTCDTSDPLGAAPTCTSGTYWTGGDHESPQMHPGAACISCHKTSFEAPWFTVAGTVYPTGHEPTDCNGAAGAATIVITDANNTTYNLSVNSAGNFYSSNFLMKFPIRAKVVANGKERVMVAEQMSGDCNSCHDQGGANMAPGRIVLP